METNNYQGNACVHCRLHLGWRTGNQDITDLWCTNPKKAPQSKQISSHIAQNRWCQIQRYFHISKPQKKTNGAKQSPFEKLEPLDEHLRKMFKKYWRTGTHLAVDETIQRFTGRTSEKVNIPSKPEPEGFKIWVLANAGYVLDWMHHAKGEKNGPVDLEDYWTKWLGFSKTEAVVLDLVTQEGICSKNKHIVWLDNLFTSTRLLQQLKEEGFGAAGTVRTTKTAREDIEASKGTQAQKQNKNENRGFKRSLANLKLEHNTQIPWGQLHAEVNDDGDILQVAWKDQNVVLFMTTVDKPGDTIIRKRRRPAKTATNSKTSWAVFGDSVEMDLPIPVFIDRYNHFMNGVDVADQLRSYYNTQRRHGKNWLPLWHFLLDTTITNCYKITQCSPKRPWGEPERHPSHKAFRLKLVDQLFEHSERIGHGPIEQKPLDKSVAQVSETEHQYVNFKVSKPCGVCKAKGRKGSRSPRSRKPLGQLCSNKRRVSDDKELKRPEQYPRSQFGCQTCNMFICSRSNCWQEHLEEVKY